MPDMLVSSSSSSSTEDSPPAQSFSLSAAYTPVASTSTANKKKKQRSCPSCRLRRVACIRVVGQEENACVACIPCTSKGIVCVPPPPPQKRTLKRGGVRIDQAKAAFGSPSDALTNLLHGDIGFSAPSQQLITHQLQSSLASDLIQSYLSSATERALLIDNTSFRLQFELANYQLSNMSDASQVLCSVLMAISARHSDHPAIVGENAPRADQLAALSLQGSDLSEFARARENACSALLQRATTLIDDKKTLRTPSLESVASLVLLEGLLDPDDPSLSSYIGAYITHTRHLLQTEENAFRTDETGSAIGWTAYGRDAICSAKKGKSRTFSDDDLVLLSRGDNRPPSLSAILPLPMTTTAKEYCWGFFMSFMIEVTDISELIATRLTGVRARKARRIDLEAVEDCLNRLGRTEAAIPELTRRRELYALESFTSDVKDAKKHSEVIRVARCAAVFGLDEIVEKRVQEEQGRGPRFFEIGGNDQWDSAEKYLRTLEMLRERTKERAFDAAMEIAQFLEATLLSGVTCGTNDWLDSMGIKIIFDDLPSWVRYILDTATVEEGGSIPDFGFAKKLNALDWIYKAILSSSWTSTSLASAAPWLKTEIKTLEARQHQYWHDLLRAQNFTPQAPVLTDSGSTLWDTQFLSMLGVEVMDETSFSDAVDASFVF